MHVATAQDWPLAWAWLSPKLAGRHVLALVGDLGAGKTTFVKTIAAQLGSTAEVTSPTFSIVQEYPTPEGPLFHFDLYRLDSIEEVLDLDFEAYLDQARFCVVEWPAVAAPLLPESLACWAQIQLSSTHGRELLLL